MQVYLGCVIRTQVNTETSAAVLGLVLTVGSQGLNRSMRVMM